MSGEIRSIAELEACVGVAPLGVRMKIIDHLDAEADRWIAASRLAFVGLSGADGPRVTAAGGGAGFAEVVGRTRLRLPLASLDPVGEIAAGQGAGVLFMATGIGETLRANGRVATVSDAAVELEIEECFIHCAKALIRSAFWTAGEAQAPDDATAFVNSSRFLALATQDADGRIDISPKGDPAGLLIRLDGHRASLAERPGNRLAFGYRNIVADPRVAALAVIPGATKVATLAGRAHLTTDETLRASFVVDGRTPILATVIEGVAPVLRDSPALARACIWNGEARAAAIDRAAAFVAHVKLNKARGVAATLMKLSVSRGLVETGLKANYKSQLY